jgi:hypothetical protein
MLPSSPVSTQRKPRRVRVFASDVSTADATGGSFTSSDSSASFVFDVEVQQPQPQAAVAAPVIGASSLLVTDAVDASLDFSPPRAMAAFGRMAATRGAVRPPAQGLSLAVTPANVSTDSGDTDIDRARSDRDDDEPIGAESPTAANMATEAWQREEAEASDEPWRSSSIEYLRIRLKEAHRMLKVLRDSWDGFAKDNVPAAQVQKLEDVFAGQIHDLQDQLLCKDKELSARANIIDDLRHRLFQQATEPELPVGFHDDSRVTSPSSSDTDDSTNHRSRQRGDPTGRSGGGIVRVVCRRCAEVLDSSADAFFNVPDDVTTKYVARISIETQTALVTSIDVATLVTPSAIPVLLHNRRVQTIAPADATTPTSTRDATTETENENVTSRLPAPLSATTFTVVAGMRSRLHIGDDVPAMATTPRLSPSRRRLGTADDIDLTDASVLSHHRQHTAHRSALAALDDAHREITQLKRQLLLADTRSNRLESDLSTAAHRADDAHRHLLLEAALTPNKLQHANAHSLRPSPPPSPRRVDPFSVSLVPTSVALTPRVGMHSVECQTNAVANDARPVNVAVDTAELQPRVVPGLTQTEPTSVRATACWTVPVTVRTFGCETEVTFPVVSANADASSSSRAFRGTANGRVASAPATRRDQLLVRPPRAAEPNSSRADYFSMSASEAPLPATLQVAPTAQSYTSHYHSISSVGDDDRAATPELDAGGDLSHDESLLDTRNSVRTADLSSDALPLPHERLARPTALNSAARSMLLPCVVPLPTQNALRDTPRQGRRGDTPGNHSITALLVDEEESPQVGNEPQGNERSLSRASHDSVASSATRGAFSSSPLGSPLRRMAESSRVATVATQTAIVVLFNQGEQTSLVADSESASDRYRRLWSRSQAVFKNAFACIKDENLQLRNALQALKRLAQRERTAMAATASLKAPSGSRDPRVADAASIADVGFTSRDTDMIPMEATLTDFSSKSPVRHHTDSGRSASPQSESKSRSRSVSPAQPVPPRARTTRAQELRAAAILRSRRPPSGSSAAAAASTVSL